VGPPAHLVAREQLFDILLSIVREDELSQCALMHIFKLTQPRASNLAHRHVESFNCERLIDMLARVGVRLDIAASSRDWYRRWDFGDAARKVYPGQPWGPVRRCSRPGSQGPLPRRAQVPESFAMTSVEAQ
jgi:predicted XRE-type DNA-binding protein